MISGRRAVAFWAAVALQLAILVALPMPRLDALRSGRTVMLSLEPEDPYSAMSGYYAILSFEASAPGTYYASLTQSSVGGTTEALVREYLHVMVNKPTTTTMEQLGLSVADLDRVSSAARSRGGPQTPVLGTGTTTLSSATLEAVHRGAQRSGSWSPSVSVPFSDGDSVYALLEERGAGEPWKPVKLLPTLPSKLPPNQVALRGTYDRFRIKFGIEEFYIPETERGNLDKALDGNRPNARAEIRVDGSGRAVLMALHVGNRTWPAR